MNRIFIIGALLWIGLTSDPQRSLAATQITLDGQFGDWSGQAMIADPEGDVTKSNGQGDIKALYYATNANQDTIFLMVEKWNAVNTPPVVYTVWFDTDNDGSYSGVGDRRVEVTYKSTASGSQVTVRLLDASGTLIRTLATDRPWGEYSAGGGTRCEFSVTFADLGISPQQPITMYLSSDQGGSTDSSAFVQWSPANALGYPLLGLGIAAAICTMIRQQRRRPA